MHVAGLMQLLGGSIYSAILCTTAELSLAEALHGGPRTLDELATTCGTDREALGRLLRALAVMGLVVPLGEEGYASTEGLGWLRAEADGSLRALALLGGHPAIQRAWRFCAEAVRTGKTAFELAHGRPLFEYLDDDDTLRAVFQRSLSGPEAWNEAIALALELSGRSRVIDVGAGDGRLLAAILRRYPALSGVAFDRPSVAAAGRARDPSLAWEGGDFFEGVPEGGDVYVLRWIVHDWSDDQAVAILRRCRAAMREGAVLVLVERVLVMAHDGDAALLDLTMLVLTGGRERSEDEYAALLGRAGLRLDRVLPTAAGLRILEASAAPDQGSTSPPA